MSALSAERFRAFHTSPRDSAGFSATITTAAITRLVSSHSRPGQMNFNTSTTLMDT